MRGGLELKVTFTTMTPGLQIKVFAHAVPLSLFQDTTILRVKTPLNVLNIILVILDLCKNYLNHILSSDL